MEPMGLPAVGMGESPPMARSRKI